MVQVHETIDEFRTILDRLRADGATVGFTPTMGYLHEGHASLMVRSAQECDVAVASVFVNPLQFAAHEDLGTYPRDLDRDLAVMEKAGVIHVLVPSVEEMYPRPVLTTVSVAEISTRFEGASRPEHFAGVATVVAKLFSLVGPCRSYFGEKDFQQLAVVRRMAGDLSMPVEVVGCDIVRDHDGLALSSRNVYLEPAQRAAAPVLYRALRAGRDLAAMGETEVAAITAVVADLVAEESEARLDYIDLVDAASLEPIRRIDPAGFGGSGLRLLIAAHFGATRLLDNVAVAGSPVESLP